MPATPTTIVLAFGTPAVKGEAVVVPLLGGVSEQHMVHLPRSLARRLGEALCALTGAPAAAPSIAATPQPPKAPRPPRGPVKHVWPQSAQYLAILAAKEASPATPWRRLCLDAGVKLNAFYAWKSHQLTRAKHPVPALRAAAAAARNHTAAAAAGLPLTKPGGGL